MPEVGSENKTQPTNSTIAPTGVGLMKWTSEIPTKLFLISDDLKENKEKMCYIGQVLDENCDAMIQEISNPSLIMYPPKAFPCIFLICLLIVRV